jgi:hypothetical protein
MTYVCKYRKDLNNWSLPNLSYYTNILRSFFLLVGSFMMLSAARLYSMMEGYNDR